MNLSAIRRQIASIQARLEANADQAFHIPRHSGMLGLRMAIQRAEEARGSTKHEEPAGQPMSPIARLREAILKEQAWRAENGPDIYRDCEAIYDEEPSQCTVAPISQRDK